MPTNPAEIQLSPEQQALIALQSERTGRPWDELLRELISVDVFPATTDESALEAAERLGLIGICNGAPSDLSSNPEHLEGFGE